MLSDKLSKKGNNAADAATYTDNSIHELAQDILSEASVVIVEPSCKCYIKTSWIFLEKALRHEIFNFFLCVRRGPIKKHRLFNRRAVVEHSENVIKDDSVVPVKMDTEGR